MTVKVRFAMMVKGRDDDERTKTLVMPLKNMGPDVSNTRHAVEKRHPERFRAGSRLSSG